LERPGSPNNGSMHLHLVTKPNAEKSAPT
jgi:hypothetical protein